MRREAALSINHSTPKMSFHHLDRIRFEGLTVPSVVSTAVQYSQASCAGEGKRIVNTANVVSRGDCRTAERFV